MPTSSTLTLTAALVLTVIGSAIAQSPPTTPAPVPSATSRAVEPAGPPVPLGPYPEITIDPAEGLPTHTVYRPVDLTAFPGKDRLPVVVWGNGACRMDGLMYERYLRKIASHGFLVVVVGPKDAREVAAKAGTPVPGGATGAHLTQAINWGIAENSRTGSPLRGKIDTDRVAMMGQSCGGLMAIEVANDPRVDTLVIWNSGVFNTPPPGMSRLTSATKEHLGRIRANTAYFNGGVSDIAFENSNDDVSRINQVPLFYGVMKEGGHAATYAHVNGGKFGEVGANWLMWRLKDDQKAGAMFEGPQCGLCQDAAWTVQKKGHAVKRIVVAAAIAALSVGWATAQSLPGWIEAGRGGRLAGEMTFANSGGRLGVLFTAGPIETKGHPFFTPLGSNGRACVTCHQPSNAMSLSVSMIRERWRVTGGRDPLFAAIDGSNNPSLPQDQERSHSLLLNRGLIRVALPWPPQPIAGKAVMPEFEIEIVSDPTGVNLDPTYGFTSRRPAISVFRRPRPAANLKYVMTPDATFNIKTGELTATDPDTGEPVGMNLMADSRHLTLKQQATGAYFDHLQGQNELTPADLKTLVEFESQVYVAQASNHLGASLVEANGPAGLGPLAMADGRVHVLANNTRDPVFRTFEPWMKPERLAANLPSAEREFRLSVARGSDIFLLRQFWIRDVAHINSIGLGNPIKRTCTTCHNAQMTGMDLAPGWVDVGTANYPTWTEPPVFSEQAELPVFKITCRRDAPPHPYLGRSVYTTDPGRALITGRCNDVGSIVMGQFRGLAARAPYFSNGSAATLRELVDFYDRRFDMKLSEIEKQDLVNFLSVL